MKKTLLITLLLSVAALSFSQKISELPTATGRAPGSWVPVVQSGATKKILTDSLSAWLTNGQHTYYNVGSVGVGTNAPSAKVDISATGLGVTQSTAAGLALVNLTPATAISTVQISPAIRWRGSAWKTASTAASQTVDFRAHVLTGSDVSTVSGRWQLESSVNGGAFNNRFAVGALGEFFINGSQGTNGQFLKAGGGLGQAAQWADLPADNSFFTGNRSNNTGGALVHNFNSQNLTFNNVQDHTINATGDINNNADGTITNTANSGNVNSYADQNQEHGAGGYVKIYSGGPGSSEFVLDGNSLTIELKSSLVKITGGLQYQVTNFCDGDYAIDNLQHILNLCDLNDGNTVLNLPDPLLNRGRELILVPQGSGSNYWQVDHQIFLPGGNVEIDRFDGLGVNTHLVYNTVYRIIAIGNRWVHL